MKRQKGGDLSTIIMAVLVFTIVALPFAAVAASKATLSEATTVSMDDFRQTKAHLDELLEQRENNRRVAMIHAGRIMQDKDYIVASELRDVVQEGISRLIDGDPEAIEAFTYAWTRRVLRKAEDSGEGIYHEKLMEYAGIHIAYPEMPKMKTSAIHQPSKKPATESTEQ